MKNNAVPKTNEFFDINKLPKSPGITYYGLSIPLLTNKQSPKALLEYDKKLIDKQYIYNVAGVLIYTDNLYLYSDEPAVSLKLKHQKIIEDHKASFLSYLEKNQWYIPSAWSFYTWNQAILDCKKFHDSLTKLKQIYNADVFFKKYILLDVERSGKKLSDNNINYLLEEILLDYFIVKGHLLLSNDYLKNTETWVLNCYPGKPHRSYVYLIQQNFFGLSNEKNVYERCWYDLLARKLYHFDRLDIDTFDFKNSSEKD
ncbi:MAG: hypothetical protein H6855_06895 [Rhodospirillales bacterium]|nr:hypothetical protein [Rhodospirillales bacterium]